MFPKPELSEHFYKLHEDAQRDEPADNRDHLPEDPVPGPLGQLHHYPGVIKGNIRFPAGNAGFFKEFGTADRRE